MGTTFFIVVMIVCFFIVQFLNSPEGKGKAGEYGVRGGIALGLDKEKYTVFHDVTLEHSGVTTQIDHIAVSRYGVFVIETKNMKGWIFGSENNRKWTQVIYKSKTSFTNPIMQNNWHIAMLCKVTGLKKEQCKNVVLFFGEAELKTEMPDNVLGGGLSGYISSFKKVIIDEDQVDEVVRRISLKRLKPGHETNQKHLENIRARKDRHR